MLNSQLSVKFHVRLLQIMMKVSSKVKVVTFKAESEFVIKVMTLNLKGPLFQENVNLQYCAKVMQMIIDE